VTKVLKGLAIGLPVGLLVLGLVRPKKRSQMAERMRRIWRDAREQSQQVGIRRREPGDREPVLNQLSRDELLEVYGIGEVLADRIIEGRPYATDFDILERGLVSQSVFNQLRRQVLDRYQKTA
jgi:DNA uptake protein ComE-like DNA-binding protein